MSRETRNNDELSNKIIKYASFGVIALAVIVIALFIYARNLNNEVKEGTLTSEQLSNILSNNIENTESASTEIGKSVDETSNEINNTSNSKTSENTTNEVLTTNKVTPTATTNSTKKTQKTEKNEETTEETTENEVELNFEKPVEGDIIRDFAVDSLIYSETLQEWTTHTGIDIKADKTTVVKAAEAGTVKSIKNDPRYGLTIIIEHEGGFQTVYANLLSSEFVVEGEKVEKGQSLGTVGNTAAFESADEAHLHFEIIKDSVPVAPSIYLK